MVLVLVDVAPDFEPILPDASRRKISALKSDQNFGARKIERKTKNDSI